MNLKLYLRIFVKKRNNLNSLKTLAIEYTWILCQGKNWISFIGQFVHPGGGKGMGVRGLEEVEHYFSQLQVSFN